MGQQILKQTFIANYVSTQSEASVVIGTVKICLSTPSFRGFSELCLIWSLKVNMFINVYFRITKWAIFSLAFRIKITNQLSSFRMPRGQLSQQYSNLYQYTIDTIVCNLLNENSFTTQDVYTICYRCPLKPLSQPVQKSIVYFFF